MKELDEIKKLLGIHELWEIKLAQWVVDQLKAESVSPMLLPEDEEGKKKPPPPPPFP